MTYSSSIGASAMGKHLVAVYGSLRDGLHNHDLLATAEFKGQFVSQPVFTMYAGGGFPYLVDEGTTPITMELYAVDDETLYNLDRLEGVPSFYRRHEVETPAGEMAIVYVASNSTKKQIAHMPVVDHGDWVSYLRARRAF